MELLIIKTKEGKKHLSKEGSPCALCQESCSIEDFFEKIDLNSIEELERVVKKHKICHDCATVAGRMLGHSDYIYNKQHLLFSVTKSNIQKLAKFVKADICDIENEGNNIVATVNACGRTIVFSDRECNRCVKIGTSKNDVLAYANIMLLTCGYGILNDEAVFKNQELSPNEWLYKVEKSNFKLKYIDNNGFVQTQAYKVVKFNTDKFFVVFDKEKLEFDFVEKTAHLKQLIKVITDTGKLNYYLPDSYNMFVERVFREAPFTIEGVIEIAGQVKEQEERYIKNAVGYLKEQLAKVKYATVTNQYKIDDGEIIQLSTGEVAFVEKDKMHAFNCLNGFYKWKNNKQLVADYFQLNDKSKAVYGLKQYAQARAYLQQTASSLLFADFNSQYKNISVNLSKGEITDELIVSIQLTEQVKLIYCANVYDLLFREKMFQEWLENLYLALTEKSVAKEMFMYADNNKITLKSIERFLKERDQNV